MSNRDVPAYYSQWVSSERIPDLLAGRLHAADDPRWAESGAPSAETYARWASHICGMACTKMLLEELRGERATLFELLEGAGKLAAMWFRRRASRASTIGLWCSC